MKRPKHYPGALVPEHLATMTVEHLPLDRPYYVSPGDPEDQDEPLTVFTTDDRILRMSKTAIVGGEADNPQIPMGHVGIMRTFVTDQHRGLREVYVADLRLLDNHQIVNLGNATLVENDQEELMDWHAIVSGTVRIEAFIATDSKESEFDPHRDLPKGALYGDTSLHEALKLLRKRSNKLMKKFSEREATGDIVIEPEVEPEAAPVDEVTRRQLGKGGLKAMMPRLRGMLSVRQATEEAKTLDSE